MTDFSYQLYSSRKFPPLAETLRLLKGFGYASVEGYGALYADSAAVAELSGLLGATGLTMPTAHFGLDLLESDPARVVEICTALGIRTVYCPYVLPEHRPDTGRGWEDFGRRLSAAGRPIRDAGLGFGWHNHAFEFEPTADGAIPQAAIFEGGPDLEWEADLAWVIKGGADPLAWIASHGARITAVHVKDIAPAGEKADEDGWADVGSGTVDWPALMAALKATPARHVIMEHDNPSDHARFAGRSIAAASTF